MVTNCLFNLLHEQSIRLGESEHFGNKFFLLVWTYCTSLDLSASVFCDISKLSDFFTDDINKDFFPGFICWSGGNFESTGFPGASISWTRFCLVVWSSWIRARPWCPPVGVEFSLFGSLFGIAIDWNSLTDLHSVSHLRSTVPSRWPPGTWTLVGESILCFWRL